MVRLYEISKKDVTECLEALRYVVEKKGKVIDEPMAEMLSEIYERVSRHVHNENAAPLNDTLSQIGMIQDLLGEVEGE